MRKSDKSLAWTSVLSLSAHGLFALGIALAPRPPTYIPPLVPTEVRLIEVGEFTIPPEMEEEIVEIVEEDRTEAALVEPETRVLPRTSPATPSTSVGSVGSVEPAATGMAGSLGPPGPIVDVAPVPGETEAEHERRLRAALIDPRRAAAMTVLRDDPGPVMPSGPAGLGDPGGESVRPMTVAEAEALHEGHLGAAAATKTYLSRSHATLVPHPDGTYTYRGHAFTATIRPDGEVVYSDRGAVEYDLGSGSGSFDLGDMVMGAAGQDPYAAERQWFEDEHQELIDRLVDEARVATRARSMRGIRSRLHLAWADRTHTAEQRRRMLFDIWDETSEDEDDRAARDTVMAFIRSEVPAISDEAYPDSELAALNARRSSTEPFAPY